jgi:predicted ArsR family transcriptional regulator
LVSASTEDAQHVALAVVSRRRLLEVLQSADEPLDVAALARAIGLHITTARFHLDVLERAGLVGRTVEREGRPGRPRQLYRVVAAAQASEGQRQLAGVLASALATDPDTGPRWAEQAGRRWASDQLPVDAGLSWEDGMGQVRELFARLGFSPRVVDGGQQRHLELHSCPFRELARSYPHIVCAAHLGLLRGALDQLRLPAAEQAGLRPFVEPHVCIADVPLPPQPGNQPCPELP